MRRRIGLHLTPASAEMTAAFHAIEQRPRERCITAGIVQHRRLTDRASAMNQFSYDTPGLLLTDLTRAVAARDRQGQHIRLRIAVVELHSKAGDYGAILAIRQLNKINYAYRATSPGLTAKPSP